MTLGTTEPEPAAGGAGGGGGGGSGPLGVTEASPPSPTAAAAAAPPGLFCGLEAPLTAASVAPFVMAATSFTSQVDELLEEAGQWSRGGWGDQGQSREEFICKALLRTSSSGTVVAAVHNDYILRYKQCIWNQLPVILIGAGSTTW